MEKLANFFSWKLPNSEKMNISEFINILDKNLNFFNTPWLVKIKSKYIVKYGAVKKEYLDFFEDVSKIKNLDEILEYFKLPKTFIEKIDYSNLPMTKKESAIYNIPWIAKYLVWKYPPHFKPSIDIYDFISNIKKYLPNDLIKEIKQYSKDDEEFIKSSLIQVIKNISVDNFEKLLKTLDNSILDSVVYSKDCKRNIDINIDVNKLAKVFSWDILSCRRVSISEIMDIFDTEYKYLNIDFDKIKGNSWLSLNSFYIVLFTELKSKWNTSVINSLIEKFNINKDILNWTWYKKYLKNNNDIEIDLLRVAHYLSWGYNTFTWYNLREFIDLISPFFENEKNSTYYDITYKQSWKLEIFFYSCLKDLQEEWNGDEIRFVEKLNIPAIYTNIKELTKSQSNVNYKDINLLKLAKTLSWDLWWKAFNIVDIISILENKFWDKYNNEKNTFDWITLYSDIKFFLEWLNIDEILCIINRLGLNIENFLYQNWWFTINYKENDEEYDYDFCTWRLALYFNHQLVWDWWKYLDHDINKMKFINELQEIFPILFSDKKIKFISDMSKNDWEFYKMCLGNIKDKLSFRRFLDKLRVPEEARYWVLKTFWNDTKILNADVNKIALYLSGKLYWNYKEPFDKYELITTIKDVSLSIYEPDFYSMINSNDFYSMVLNAVKRRSNKLYIELINKLNIPNELLWILKEGNTKDIKNKSLDLDNSFDVKRFAMFLSWVMPYYWGKLSKYQFKKVCKDNNFIDNNTLIEIDKNSKDIEDFFYIALCDMKLNWHINNLFVNKFKPYLDNINKDIPSEFLLNISKDDENANTDNSDIDVWLLALKLSWKCKENNYTKFSRLLFCEYLTEIYGYDYKRLDFYWNQADKYEETFYKMLLEKLQKESKKDILSKSSFEKLLKNINGDIDINKEKSKDNYNFKTLAYYLAGSLRNHYRMPDMLEIVDYMHDLEDSITIDSILKIFQISNGNINKEEYFQTLLKYFFRNYEQKFPLLLEKLEIPTDIYFKDIFQVK